MTHYQLPMEIVAGLMTNRAELIQIWESKLPEEAKDVAQLLADLLEDRQAMQAELNDLKMRVGDVTGAVAAFQKSVDRALNKCMGAESDVE